MRAHLRRYKMCRNCHKKTYPSRVVAEDMAAYRMSHEPPGYVIAVYECPVQPRMFHITKSNMAARHRREGRNADG